MGDMTGGEAVVDASQLIEFYRTMLLLRRFEEKAGVLFALGTLSSPVPRNIGREAVFAAIGALARNGDGNLLVASTFPSPALCLTLGGPPEHVLRAISDGGSYHNGETNVPSGPYHDNLFVHDVRQPLPQKVAFLPGDLASTGARPSILLTEAHAGGIAGGSVDRAFANPTVTAVVMPASQCPAPGSVIEDGTVRVVSGGDPLALYCMFSNLIAGGPPGSTVWVATPEFRGHQSLPDRARDRDARGADPLNLCRQKLLDLGLQTPDDLKASEDAIRREVVAAAAALGSTC